MLKHLDQNLLILLSLTLKRASRGTFNKNKEKKARNPQPKLFKGFDCFIILSGYICHL